MLKSMIALVCASVQLCGAEGPGNSTSIVAVERSFARRCQQVGVRASFMEYFADDGIAFKPEPFRYTETVKKLPPQPDPKAILLEWEPQVAGVASSGDLGYTSGPSIRTDGTAKESPKRYGQFFSVWKKQQDGNWKVAVDIGIETPTPASPLGRPCTEVSASGGCQGSDDSTGKRGEAMIVRVESEFGKSCGSEGTLQAYVDRVDEHSLLYRENRLPVSGADAIERYLASEQRIARWSPMKGEVSTAGDLGYTYGSYELGGSDRSEPGEKGYYLHVWRCNEHGGWKLIVDVAKPEPPASGP